MPSHLDLIRVSEAYIRCDQAALIPGLEKHEANILYQQKKNKPDQF